MKTFGITNSRDMMAELMKCYDEYEMKPTSTSIANLFCLYSWHLTDWVFNEFKDVHHAKNLGDFRESLYSRCPPLKTMSDIANSFKHSKLIREKAYIRNAGKVDGPSSSALPRISQRRA